jgi:GNAT superfamily N-acetyltransferase
MDTEGGTAAWPLLLVRRADPAGEQHVTALLRPVVADRAELGGLVRQSSVFVLSDLTLPLSAPPVAAVMFRLDLRAGTAQLTGMAVRQSLRHRGLGRRLLAGTLTLLRAEGYRQVHAQIGPGDAGASLLRSLGFTAERGAAGDGTASCLILPL